ncbi:mCG142425 [Mus musculus]|uniref:Uncharacterized protein n=1 Tax=Mus musculus TaxID=10090 RepID=Q9D5I9_MOUSE|nr:mCG142425 [Mus musculus]BAB29788.1 unnamed protein product [Mus musculus]
MIARFRRPSRGFRGSSVLKESITDFYLQKRSHCWKSVLLIGREVAPETEVATAARWTGSKKRRKTCSHLRNTQNPLMCKKIISGNLGNFLTGVKFLSLQQTSSDQGIVRMNINHRGYPQRSGFKICLGRSDTKSIIC